MDGAPEGGRPPHGRDPARAVPRRFSPNSTGAHSPALVGASHRLTAAPLSLHPTGGPRSIPTLYYGNRSTRVFLRGATPLATVCHGALLSAREGPWCVTSSPARLHGLCIWMPKALATELGPRTFASRSCAVLTWRAVPAGAAEGSPRTVHRLARL